jgi:hypothetical protein
MNNQVKTVLVLTVLILSTATISYGAKPENPGKPENNLPSLLNQVSDLLKQVIEGFQTLNDEIHDIEDGITDLQKSTDAVNNTLNSINGNLDPSKNVESNNNPVILQKDVNITLTATWEEIFLNITCDKPYELSAIYLTFNSTVVETIYSLGLSYIDHPYYFMVSQKYFDSKVTSTEVLSAIGISNRPVALANETFKLTCLLYTSDNPDDLGGTQELYVRVMVFAPSDALIECVQTDIPPI